MRLRAPRRGVLATLALLPIAGAAPLQAATPAAAPAGPAAHETAPLVIPADPFAGLAPHFRQLARQDDSAKDWHRALMRWQAVATLDPADPIARQRIVAIQALLKTNAERHFALAKAALQKEQYARAFREFLRTLSYDPGNHLALEMVKHELNAKSVLEYTVARGDTLHKIAVAQYQDPDLTYLVQYYNDVTNPRALEVGQVLKLPVMVGVNLAAPAPPGLPAPPAQAAAPEIPKAAPGKPKAAAPPPVSKAEPGRKARPAAPPPASEAARDAAGTAIVAAEASQTPQTTADYSPTTTNPAFAKAKALFDQKQYEGAATAAESVLENDPANQDARELVNAATYERGQALRRQKQPVAALQVLTRVDPDYKDTGTVVASLKDELKGQEAEVHYIAGVTAYLQEDLDTAIGEWELTLKLDPGHRQATKDLENAKALRDKLSAVK